MMKVYINTYNVQTSIDFNNLKELDFTSPAVKNILQVVNGKYLYVLHSECDDNVDWDISVRVFLLTLFAIVLTPFVKRVRTSVTNLAS